MRKVLWCPDAWVGTAFFVYFFEVLVFNLRFRRD